MRGIRAVELTTSGGKDLKATPRVTGVAFGAGYLIRDWTEPEVLAAATFTADPTLADDAGSAPF